MEITIALLLCLLAMQSSANGSELNLHLPNIVKKYGYPIEDHSVTTEDGYILTLYRMPYGVNYASKYITNRIPVLVVHGLVSNAETFILLGPKKSLGYILADHGYDVWLGNTRGSKYSQKHLRLNATDDQFWMYSWDEIGYFDLPAMMNHILKTTKQKKLFYIGHSQGTTSFFAGISKRPQFNERIKLMIALAPAVFMGHIEQPVLRYFAMHPDQLEQLREYAQTYRMLPQRFVDYLKETCRDVNNFYLCARIFFFIVGEDWEQLEPKDLPKIAQSVPDNSSFYQAVHYSQLIMSHKFTEFDYGPLDNMKIYGSPMPKEYNLTRVTSPVAIYYGKNDMLVAVKDVEKLITKLPNLIHVELLKHKNFSHMDFVYAINTYDMLYKDMISLMKKYH